ncbi:hypothetical protein ACFL2M_02040 [Patescibacteria group bacterium]
MLKKTYMIPISVLCSVAVAALGFYMFTVVPQIAFEIYNIGALLVGVVISVVSALLVKKEVKKKSVYYLLFLLGFGMAVVHVVKLIVGNCI